MALQADSTGQENRISDRSGSLSLESLNNVICFLISTDWTGKKKKKANMLQFYV